MPPVIGALVAAGLGGLFSSLQTVFANKYNSPKSQLKRLRKAGLPLAYMYKGNINQQSDVPKLSIDPDLGTSKQINLEQQKTLIDAQVPKIEVDTKAQDLANQITEGEVNWLKQQGLLNVGDGKFFEGTNQEIMFKLERANKLANTWIADRTAQIKRIQAAVETNLFNEGYTQEKKYAELNKIKQQLINLASQDNLLVQLHGIRGLEEIINSSITDEVDDMESWQFGLWSMLMKLFSKSSGK